MKIQTTFPVNQPYNFGGTALVDAGLNDRRVSLFAPNLEGGGAQLAVLNLALGFAARGMKVSLVLTKAEGAYLARVPPQVKIVNLESRAPEVLSKTLALRRYLRRERPDFLISSLDIFGAATWAQVLAGVPTRVVLMVQNNISELLRDTSGRAGGKLRMQTVRWFYPWADAVVAVSQGVAEDLADIADMPLADIEVIYNPVVMKDFQEKARERVDHPWFTPGGPPVILGAGRLVKQKDFATLVRAFAAVRRRREARLMILGATDYREPTIKPELARLIGEFGLQNDAALIGFVDNPYSYMAAARVFVLSSIHEGFGNVVAEALAAGTPVVSTDCESGPAEILGHGEYGQLAPVGDAEALGAAILETLDRPADSAKLRRRAEDFSEEKIVGQYMEVLQSIDRRKK